MPGGGSFDENAVERSARALRQRRLRVFRSWRVRRVRADVRPSERCRGDIQRSCDVTVELGVSVMRVAGIWRPGLLRRPVVSKRCLCQARGRELLLDLRRQLQLLRSDQQRSLHGEQPMRRRSSGGRSTAWDLRLRRAQRNDHLDPRGIQLHQALRAGSGRCIEPMLQPDSSVVAGSHPKRPRSDSPLLAWTLPVST
jgi:hypothetical protein